jgi:hypothetical protein
VADIFAQITFASAQAYVARKPLQPNSVTSCGSLAWWPPIPPGSQLLAYTPCTRLRRLSVPSSCRYRRGAAVCIVQCSAVCIVSCLSTGDVQSISEYSTPAIIVAHLGKHKLHANRRKFAHATHGVRGRSPCQRVRWRCRGLQANADKHKHDIIYACMWRTRCRSRCTFVSRVPGSRGAACEAPVKRLHSPWTRSLSTSKTAILVCGANLFCVRLVIDGCKHDNVDGAQAACRTQLLSATRSSVHIVIIICFWRC